MVKRHPCHVGADPHHPMDGPRRPERPCAAAAHGMVRRDGPGNGLTSQSNSGIGYLTHGNTRLKASAPLGPDPRSSLYGSSGSTTHCGGPV